MKPAANTVAAAPRTFGERSLWWRVGSDFMSAPGAVAGLVVLALVVLAALAAPWITPQNPYDLMQLDVLDARLAPGTASSAGDFTYWLGTDGQGRDLYSAIIYGLRISLLVGVGSALDCATVILVGMMMDSPSRSSRIAYPTLRVSSTTRRATSRRYWLPRICRSGSVATARGGCLHA